MLRCTMESEMVKTIERILDFLFAPLARELARLPASAFRHILAGL